MPKIIRKRRGGAMVEFKGKLYHSGEVRGGGYVLMVPHDDPELPEIRLCEEVFRSLVDNEQITAIEN